MPPTIKGITFDAAKDLLDQPNPPGNDFNMLNY